MNSIDWQKQLRSPLIWHLAGSAVLAILVVVLGVRFTLDWIATSGSHTDALASKQVELKALNLETEPLRGLDQRVALSQQQVAAFYAHRVPQNYSAIAERIGQLQVKAGVRLTRVNYAQGKPGTDLTEVSLDIGISGAYPEIKRFVNELERDPMFFVVRAMALTGQQGGQVNLRLNVSTWLRPADAEQLPANTSSAQPTREDK